MSENKATQQPLPFALRAVYIRESRLRMPNDFDPLLPNQQLVGKFRTHNGTLTQRTATSPEAGTMLSCAFTNRFEFRYSKSSVDQPQEDLADDEANLVAEISADISVDYIVTATEFPPVEALQQWGTGAALFHAWPYWREYCHSSMLRMNLPAALLPMLEVKASPINGTSASTGPVEPSDHSQKRTKRKATSKPRR